MLDKKGAELLVNDTVSFFDKEHRFRCGRVLQIGHKWVRIYVPGTGKKSFKPEELEKYCPISSGAISTQSRVRRRKSKKEG